MKIFESDKPTKEEVERQGIGLLILLGKKMVELDELKHSDIAKDQVWLKIDKELSIYTQINNDGFKRLYKANEDIINNGIFYKRNY